ncbi:RAD52 motif-containing protein 1 isoform X2 [Genypterus blacodes]|uniref:RAD52 motif-containing protein 1 isoform X2 n=1 Tax=Genypterus blacodes TaxID=154954 RepID=UPI003F776F0E
MDLEVDVLEFQVPVSNSNTLFIWNLHPSHTEVGIYEQLSAVFSSFGPLYLLKVRPNAPQAPPGYYALVKFFSAAQASKAQRQTDGQTLFQNQALKVRLSSKQTPSFLSNSSRPLSHFHCLELANQYLGFNGWSSRIIALKDLTNEEGEEQRRDRRLRLGCVVQLSFPQHGQTSRGTAVLEDSFTETGPDVVLQRRCRLYRAVRQAALVQAFSSVLLILLGNGKVMVEVRQDRGHVLAEQTDDVLQVNEFSISDLVPNENEDEDEGHQIVV